MLNCLIKQPAGLGDILFLQKIAHIHKLHGYNVTWPVISEYKWLKDYIPHFDFVDQFEGFPYKDEYLRQRICTVYDQNDLRIITTDGCGNGIETMKSKYDLINMDWSNWQDYLKFERNTDKEDSLYYNFLGLKDDEEYIFSMKYMGSPNGYINALNLPVPTDKKVVYLDFVEGYTMFDWCKVLENATEIHIEGSAIVYVAEVLNLKAKVLELYSRDDHRHFRGLFRKRWNFNKSPIK